MILLAVDTSSALATAALLLDGVCLLALEADGTKKHAETIAPLVDELLVKAGVSMEQIDRFAVDIGPGSFTGVRIGVSFVNAMAYALGKPVVPVDALFTLYTACGEREKPVAALVDARNGNAYAALYQAGRTLIAPSAVETAAFLAQMPKDALLIGDTAEPKTFPRAEFAGRAALILADAAMASVEPLYLRSAQAERLREAKRGEQAR